MTSLIVTECNPIGIERDFSFDVYELSQYVFSESYISELFGMSNKITSECSTHHLRIDKALFNITNRCLLVKTLNVPHSMRVVKIFLPLFGAHNCLA